MSDAKFRYEPLCSAPGCTSQASYKVAAPWSDGTSQELKNYGLTCAEHRAAQLERARKAREGLKLAEGETLGPIGLYQLLPGHRDRELTKLRDDGA